THIMRNLLSAAVALLIIIASLSAQPLPQKIFTRPKLPARDVLERMGLKLAWNARVTVDGQRDGVFSVQIIPGTPTQILVQTWKGAVYLYDADNGDLVWKNPKVGTYYWTPQPAGFNSHSIFVSRRNLVHVLNRFDGAERVFTVDPRTKIYAFGFEVNSTPTATLVADEDALHVTMGNRVHTIGMPDFDAIEKATKRARALRKERIAKGDKGGGDDAEAPQFLDSPQPFFLWGYGIGEQVVTSPPLLYGPLVSIQTMDGTLTSISRYKEGKRDEYFAFKATGNTPAPTGQHLYMAYIGSDDFNLYAIDMRSGKLKWRYVSG